MTFKIRAASQILKQKACTNGRFCTDIYWKYNIHRHLQERHPSWETNSRRRCEKNRLNIPEEDKQGWSVAIHTDVHDLHKLNSQRYASGDSHGDSQALRRTRQAAFASVSVPNLLLQLPSHWIITNLPFTWTWITSHYYSWGQRNSIGFVHAVCRSARSHGYHRWSLCHWWIWRPRSVVRRWSGTSWAYGWRLGAGCFAIKEAGFVQASVWGLEWLISNYVSTCTSICGAMGNFEHKTGIHHSLRFENSRSTS